MVMIYKVLEQGSFAWVKTGPGGIERKRPVVPL